MIIHTRLDWVFISKNRSRLLLVPSCCNRRLLALLYLFVSIVMLIICSCIPLPLEPNEPPSTPTILAADSLAIVGEPWLVIVSSSDPEDQLITYRVFMEGEYTNWTSYCASAVPCSVYVIFSYGGLLEVQFQARDTEENLSSLSSPFMVHVTWTSNLNDTGGSELISQRQILGHYNK